MTPVWRKNISAAARISNLGLVVSIRLQSQHLAARRPVAALVLAALVAAIGCSSPHDEPAERVLQARLTKAPLGSPLQATSVLPADGWDRLYVFAPYTPDDVEKAALGKAWQDQYSQELGDSTSVLVLTKHGTVVDWLALPRVWGADLLCVRTPKGGFDRRAVFERLRPTPTCPDGGTVDVEEP